ncbi:hypothetical protein T4B_94 [Trichinella pseudospiralis]|uniref:Uncharacterized protein n=1 Tax=Trichinella pseudospiralis TaxID=6337 RepID=A0A0V1G959_TRIPS|nr:hypothetical protein T4B_94 [Trichinella pseudospiralis]
MLAVFLLLSAIFEIILMHITFPTQSLYRWKC